MYKNKVSQKTVIYAHDTVLDIPRVGDAANITAKISKDGGAQASTNDVNPTEVGSGCYTFDNTQAETNADLVITSASSSTSDVAIDPVVIYTTENDAIKTVTDNIPDSGALTTLSALVDDLETRLTAARAAKLDNLDALISTIRTTSMTESYASKGVAPTIEQSLFMMLSILLEMSTSGTTGTTKKLDQATTAMTLTFDDASNPTSITRNT